jgi:hypothetical protein
MSKDTKTRYCHPDKNITEVITDVFPFAVITDNENVRT